MMGEIGLVFVLTTQQYRMFKTLLLILNGCIVFDIYLYLAVIITFVCEIMLVYPKLWQVTQG